ncbi:GntR family transcriptional regulator [Neoroseomonas soli]|uniref:GntR family transcriptional regulator n=1 Tax=Neoroseomonas soli TaxID=1081025 RepID=A0A9X9X1Q5_9PROT|nr:GntR family transcriptional regulator [Neoroseomonas soli]MBR0673334.1 GntR family transcriptional regulator [Neoroseomonas soli]
MSQDLLPKPLPYHLMEQIRREIIAGRHAAGAPLREQALQIEYGCSRAPIREALRLLERRGLVTHEPRHGFRVREVSATEVRQIYEVRALLEKQVVLGLLGRVTPELIAELHATNATMRAHRAAGDVERYIEANIAFHAVLRAHAPNEPLGRALDVVYEMAEPIRHALLHRSLRTSQAAEQHDDIISLLEADRVVEAAEEMYRHVFTGMPVALGTVAHPEGSNG